jgi:mannose-6-phosphate isomerase-like protein (cupin superfamily)
LFACFRFLKVEIKIMLFKSIEKILSFEANDKTVLKEIIHPKNDDLELSYSLAHASLDIGESSLPHRLINQSEVYVFLEGTGIIIVEEEQRHVNKGDVVLVPKGARQHVENKGDVALQFLCIVAPPWQENEDLTM